MKKTGILLCCAFFISLSCSKREEKVIDCAIELLFTSISYQADPNDPKEIHFTLTYDQEFTTTVQWVFGDGSSETKNGTTVTHTYDTAGRYELTANITLSADDHVSCSVSKDKTVDVY